MSEVKAVVRECSPREFAWLGIADRDGRRAAVANRSEHGFYYGWATVDMQLEHIFTSHSVRSRKEEHQCIRVKHRDSSVAFSPVIERSNGSIARLRQLLVWT